MLHRLPIFRRLSSAFCLFVIAVSGSRVVAEVEAGAIQIVEQGQPRAVIVLPDAPTAVAKYAAEELRYHIRRASGAELDVVPESEHDAEQPAIYLGPTDRARQAGIDPSEIQENGFVIRRAGDDLLMVGHDSDGQPLGGYTNQTRVGTLFAVYEFLESHLGVRWLWPGELGEFIPEHPSISVREWDQQEGYPYEWTQLRVSAGKGLDGWSSDQARDDFIHVQDVWLKRQRFSQLRNIRPGHNFEEYWKRFGDTHPEFFAQLPTGERRPLNDDGSGIRTSMCVSQPALWDQIIEDWVESGRARWNGIITIGENDVPGMCVCESCRGWDADDPRFASSTYWSGQIAPDRLNLRHRFGGEGQSIQLVGSDAPSLSDRYARFYLAVQKRAEQVNPEARVAGFAYANYVEPPVETKLNDRVVLAIVPGKGEGAYFPWTERRTQEFKEQWQGWYDTGARLLLRPNYTLVGHNFPVFYARELAHEVSFAIHHGMIGSDFDSLIGSWGVQGPTLYTLGRIHNRPDLTADEILDEYYAAFGQAEAAVRDYFGYWEKVSSSVTPEEMDAIGEKTGYRDHRGWVVMGPHIFTPEVMAEGRALLEAAKRAAEGDVLTEKRVAYLDKGLTHTEKTIAVQAAHEAYRDSPDVVRLEAYRRAIRDLELFRHEVEPDYINHMGYLARNESRVWDRSLATLDELGTDLPPNWKLQWDPDQEGTDREWYAPAHDVSDWHPVGVDSHWREQPPGRSYRQAHGNDYEGVAWYRNEFELEDAVGSGERIVLAFGAVDAACTIWLNGQRIHERGFPYRGNSNSWAEPFEVDATEAVDADSMNTLAIRVDPAGGPGGIWRPVRLVRRNLSMVDEKANLIRNPTFAPDVEGWRYLHSEGEARMDYDAADPLFGSHAARIRTRGQATGRIVQSIEHADPGSRYRLRLWIRTSPEFTGRISAKIEGKSSSVRNTGGSWQELVVDDVSTNRDRLYLALWFYDAVGTFWVDGAELTAVRN